MQNKYNYLFIFLLIFFSSLPNVEAITFRKNTAISNGRMYYNSKLDFNSSYKKNTYNHGSVIKQYSKNGKDYYYAYCSDKSVNFYSGSSYTQDTTYKNTAKCTYKVKENGVWVSKKGGDCSQLLGYTIQAAYAKAQTITSCNTSSTQLTFCKYGYAQAAVWTYLSLYTYKDGNSSYLRTNNKYSELKYAYDNNSTLRSIIQNAWTNYNNDINTGKISNSELTDDNMYTIAGEGATDKKFYYVPDSDKCGSDGGVYKTKTTTITNNKKTTISLTISTKNTGFEIVFIDGSGKEYKTTSTTYTTEVGAGETIQFFLRTKKFIGATETNVANAEVNIYGELTIKSTSTDTYTTYDSERWTKKGAQGLILVTTNSKNYLDNIKYKKDTSLTFTQDKLDFKTPTGSSTDSGTGKCANIATNTNETATELKGSSCKTINLGNGNFVRIIITETVRFSYGYLYPSKYNDVTKEPVVYAGGSFNLNTNTSLGAITKYEVGIKWQYADYNLATNTPYFYNATNINQTNPNTTTIIDGNNQITIKEKINKVLLEGSGSDKGILDKYNNLTLDVDTYNSNDLDSAGNGINYDYSFNIYETSQSKTAIGTGFNANNELKLTISKIELNRYKMKDGTNGEVEYCTGTDQKCKESGYENRAYFVPMYYSDETFKFNIKKQDISLINEIKLNYEGICNIKTNNQFNGESLRYRTISVSDPFPKANKTTGEGIPSNWKNWYLITANKKRISETFNKESIYSINITSEKQKQINEFNDNSYYTDWDNMSTTGSSKVIRDLFDKKANNTSYCGLGIFKESCDK